MAVDFGLGFDGVGFIGEDGSVEEREIGEGLENPWAVDGVGVGKDDEAVSGGVEAADGFPHGEVGGEDVLPGDVELPGGGAGGKPVDGPEGVVSGGDAAGLEVVFFFDEGGEGAGGIGVVRGEESAEGGAEIEIEEDFSDVEEEVWHGRWGLDVGEDEAGGVNGSVAAIVGGEGGFHFTPFARVVVEQVGDGCGEVAGGLGKISGTELLEEFEVSLFLAGDEVVDEHGAAGGDCFVDGGAAGFADDEMVLAEEAGHFPGPAE